MTAPDTRMLLQRRLPAGDHARWRTVLRFGMAQVAEVDALLVWARRIDHSVAWRITTHDGRQIT